MYRFNFTATNIKDIYIQYIHMHRRHVHKASVCPWRVKTHTFGYSLKSHERRPPKENTDKIKQFTQCTSITELVGENGAVCWHVQYPPELEETSKKKQTLTKNSSE